jgi:hypothetical protein
MIFRIILIPIYIIVGFVRISVEVISRLSCWIFYLIAGILILTAVLSAGFGTEDGEGVKQLLIGSGVFLLIPQIVTVFSVLLELLSEMIERRIRAN